MEYKVSGKRKDTGKWWQFGSIKQGKYGPQLSFKKTHDLMAFIEGSGDWINFALFEKEIERQIDEPAEPIHGFGSSPEIPF